MVVDKSCLYEESAEIIQEILVKELLCGKMKLQTEANKSLNTKSDAVPEGVRVAASKAGSK